VLIDPSPQDGIPGNWRQDYRPWLAKGRRGSEAKATNSPRPHKRAAIPFPSPLLPLPSSTRVAKRVKCAHRQPRQKEYLILPVGRVGRHGREHHCGKSAIAFVVASHAESSKARLPKGTSPSRSGRRSRQFTFPSQSQRFCPAPSRVTVPAALWTASRVAAGAAGEGGRQIGCRRPPSLSGCPAFDCWRCDVAPGDGEGACGRQGPHAAVWAR